VQYAGGMAIGDKARFKALLDGYSGIQVAGSLDLIQVAGRLLKGFQAKHEAGRRLQKTTADDFNLLDTLQVADEEIRHSMMLAWLLDREATHAQGNLGFRLFLKHVGLGGEYAETPYRVVREKSGAESRIDVEVAAWGEFIIHIENKIYAGEGDDQTKREWKDLQADARELGVRRADVYGFFLTLDRHAPASPEFRAISWRQIADVLDDFSARSRADQVGLFAAHYARALRRMTFELTQLYEDENQARPES
jgi:PD-(D/E)XK nuclease superfamily